MDNKFSGKAVREALRDVYAREAQQSLDKARLEWRILGMDENHPDAIRQAYEIDARYKKLLEALDD